MTSERCLARPLTGGVAFPGPGTYVLIAAFVCLSLADFALTRYLLNTPGDCFGEANGVAQYVLTTCGWWGLAGYKLTCVAAVLAASAFVAQRRPRVATGLVGAACAALAVVVGYSALLVVYRQTDAETQECIALAEELEQRDETFRDLYRYQQRTDELAGEVAAGRLGLRDAARRLRDHLVTSRYRAVLVLRPVYGPHLNDEAVLAAHLVRAVGYVSQDDPDLVLRPLSELASEFAAEFASPLPEFASEPFHQPDGPAVPVPPTARAEGPEETAPASE